MGQRVLDKLHSMGRFDSFTYSPTGNLYVPQDPEYTKLALDELVEESGVDYLLCCQVVQADTEGGCIRRLTCADDAGLFTVEAEVYVDASG